MACPAVMTTMMHLPSDHWTPQRAKRPLVLEDSSLPQDQAEQEEEEGSSKPMQTFFSHLESGPRFLKTDTRTASYSGSGQQQSKKEYRVATFDFEGGEEADLPFRVGDVLEVLNKDDPEWFLARLGMREGIIPVNRTKAYAP